MKSRDFCYWLRGFFELTGATAGLDANQANTIRNHLNLVFKHEIDPEMGGPEQQKALNKTHSPGFDPDNLLYRC